jgi:hypothetical protein
MHRKGWWSHFGVRPSSRDVWVNASSKTLLPTQSDILLYRYYRQATSVVLSSSASPDLIKAKHGVATSTEPNPIRNKNMVLCPIQLTLHDFYGPGTTIQSLHESEHVITSSPDIWLTFQALSCTYSFGRYHFTRCPPGSIKLRKGNTSLTVPTCE